MRQFFLLGAICALAGCQMAPATPADSTRGTGGVPTGTMHPRPRGEQPPLPGVSGPDACGAGGLQHLVGGLVPQPFPARGPVRIYAQGDPVTADYSAERVNVLVDHADRRRIIAITCG